MRLIVGIDEVGRGPLAGPVSIGIVVCKSLLVMPELTDSKKMTESARERVAALAGELQKDGTLTYGVFSAPARVVDALGIEAAIRGIIASGLKELVPDPAKAEVVLDGRLRAPSMYQQQAIIRGDLLVPAISLAAVVAKVARDHEMVRMAERYPGYGFENHKGYGTKEHLAALRKLGPSSIHRMSYLSRVLGDTMPA